MDKHLEDYLWNEISYVGDSKWYTEFHRFPRDVIKEMVEKGWINSPKEGWATLDKWSRKGLYEWGSYKDLGWKCKDKE